MQRLFLGLLGLTLALPSWGEEEVSFNRQVKPILSDRCFKCHGPDSKNQKSEYRLNTEEDAYADLGGYQGIVPGNLEDSEFYLRIVSDDPDELMPPPESKMGLTADEKEILKKWIKQGAKYEKHWSFIPVPEEISVPEVEGDWAQNEIDHFTARKFKEVGLSPAQESPKEKWLRRVSFDLTGLPPTLEELDAFLADDSEDAFEKVVDRLLASDAYAERMTAEWLDVARYSDSYGYQRDDHRDVWPWRDWVLDSFRENMPYSQFITEQIAGDLLPNATEDQKLATAFNRLHGHVMEGGIVLEEFRVEYVSDRVVTAGTAFLGLTMDCTKCHDHKYDPLTAEDFYSMSSFFANIDESGLISYFSPSVPTPTMPLPSDEQREALQKADEELALAESGYRSSMAASEEEFRAWLLDRAEAGVSPLVTQNREVHLAFEKMTTGTRLDNKKKEIEVQVIENLANAEHRGESKKENVLVEGYKGKAIKVTGDDILEVRDVGAYERDQAWSASVWINPKELPARANIMSRGRGADDSAAMGYEFLLIDGVPTASVAHFWPGDAIRVQAREKIKANEWTHLGVSYDGSSQVSGLKIYVNGEPVELDIVKNSLTRTINNFRRLYGVADGKLGLVLGQRYRDSGLRHGMIDEFEFWSREVSPIEMRHAYDGKALGAVIAKDVEQLTAEERASLKELYLLTESESAKIARERLQEARVQRNKIQDEIPAISVMKEREKPRKSYILERGAYDSRGQEVTSNTPTFLPPMTEEMPKNRLGFAQWMIASNNPLTSRVTVNRYWQMVFGRGLVETSEDFGNQGTPPTHPELLDWLSRDFMSNGWDVKALLKKMVLSATYRQSTNVSAEKRKKDPQNLYLARSHATRLTAEMIRDNALATSGLLVEKWGGPTAKPYQVEVAFIPAEPDAGDGLYRRSVYTWWKRNAAAPVMTAFDAPKRDMCTVKREVTTSPIQSLILLNDPQFVEAARKLAEKLCLEYGEDTEAILQQAYRKLTSRYATKEEAKLLGELYEIQLKEFESHPEEAKKLLQVGEAPTDESLSPTFHAATAILVNAIMNLDESLTER